MRKGESVHYFHQRVEQLAPWSGFNEPAILSTVQAALTPQLQSILTSTQDTLPKTMEEFWPYIHRIESNL